MKKQLIVLAFYVSIDDVEKESLDHYLEETEKTVKLLEKELFDLGYVVKILIVPVKEQETRIERIV